MRLKDNLFIIQLLRISICVVSLVTYSNSIAKITTHSTVFDSHRSIEDGCLITQKSIKKIMIEEQCGSNIQGGGFRFKSDVNDSLSTINFEVFNGYVTKWDLLSRSIKTSEDEKTTQCSIKANIEVSCNTGTRDPDFQQINARLNKSVFIEEDDIKLFIDSAPHDRYLTIVQLITQPSGKQEVWKVFPNLFQIEQLLIANQTIYIPNGYRLIAKTIAKKDISDEGLIIITTKNKPMSLPEKASIELFYSWLTNIQLEERREVLIPYRIINKGKVP